MPTDVPTDLVSDLYACLLDDDAELVALQAICTAVGADHASTVWRKPQRADAWITSHPLADEACHIFAEVHLEQDYQRMASAVRSGTVVRMTSFLPREDILRHDVYERLLRPIDGGIAALANYPDGEGSVETAICISASRGIDFSDADLALLNLCLPHLVAITGIARRMRDLDGSRSMARDVFDLTGDGVVALDRNGRIVEANANADTLLVRGDRIRYGTGGIAAVDPDDDRRLRAAIRSVEASCVARGRVADPAATTQPTQVVLNRSRIGWPLVVTVLPARAALLSDRSAATVVLHLDDVGTARTLSPETLRREFGLTPREAALALRLADGDALQDAARGLGLSIGTARQYLKIVFDKVGVHGQGALLRTIRR